jgi:type II secretory pathway component GspD/PulD (secretin)
MNRDAVVRFALIAVLLVPGAARAQYALEILSLRHRTAEQVLPALQPLLEPGGTLTGQRNQLIVRTSPANLAELRRALEAIDRPAKRLQVSVRFDDSFEASRRAIGASGRVGSDGANVEIRARDSSSSREGRVDQRLQVLDGSHAMIYTGQSQPVRERRFIQTPAGVVSQEVTVLQDTRMGFEIVPRVSGSTVQVEIAGSNGPNAGYTTASGPLGEWFELGAVALGGNRADSGIASSAQSATSETRRVWIKVDALP